MLEVTYALAFLGGIITFLSPCILPIVIPYMTFLTGISLDQLVDREGATRISTARVMVSATAFVVGFSLVFLLFGGLIIGLSGTFRDTISTIGGLVVIVMGLHFLRVLRLGFLDRDVRVSIAERPTTLIGDFLVGVAFAAGWTPCVGMIFSGISAMAMSQETSAQGVIALFMFTLGLSLPFLLAAAFTGTFVRFFTRFRHHLGLIEKIMGLFLILIGVLILTGQLTVINTYVLEIFPELSLERSLVDAFE